MAGNIFYFFSIFNSLAEYKNLDSKFFSCSTFKILICCLLKSRVDALRVKMILICFFLFSEICSSSLEVFSMGGVFDVLKFHTKKM